MFFSFLTVFIIIGLYALFLADGNVSAIKEKVGDIEGIRFLVDSLVIAGIIIVIPITVSLGCFGLMK